MKTKTSGIPLFILFFAIISGCTGSQQNGQDDNYITISKEILKDKIKGAWAAQTIGVTYGGPTEFRYNKTIIPDSVEITWSDTTMRHTMQHRAGLYEI
ncbi:MAG: ADP-ribosylglycohydrolase family protein, partial [Saprospiraceae bacterium]|nr:ADP-ribosylglycohydrolase family protein [Saprospiraceae bacterium]